jgi:hypothetical protein
MAIEHILGLVALIVIILALSLLLPTGSQRWRRRCAAMLEPPQRAHGSLMAAEAIVGQTAVAVAMVAAGVTDARQYRPYPPSIKILSPV